MKKVIVDYKKLTPEVLGLLNQKFPDGYGDDDIITFDDHHNQTIEAVEIKTNDSKLHYTMTNFDSSFDFETNDKGHIIIDFDKTTTLTDDNILSNEEE